MNQRYQIQVAKPQIADWQRLPGPPLPGLALRHTPAQTSRPLTHGSHLSYFGGILTRRPGFASELAAAPCAVATLAAGRAFCG